MKLIILGSSSAGNGYILKGKTSSLLIEAGVPLREVKMAMKFDISSIRGAVLSHGHIDHAKYAFEYAKAGINVYSSLDTLDITGMINSHRAKVITEGRKYKIGEFTVLPFGLIHDIKNYGYLISHPEMGLTCFLTDTCYSPFIFPGLNNIIIEANYSDNVLESRIEAGYLHPVLAERIRRSHMAESTMIEFLKANDTTCVNNIVIIHLSSHNSNAQQMKSSVINVTGINPTIAKAGMCIEFNKTAF